MTRHADVKTLQENAAHLQELLSAAVINQKELERQKADLERQGDLHAQERGQLDQGIRQRDQQIQTMVQRLKEVQKEMEKVQERNDELEHHLVETKEEAVQTEKDLTQVINGLEDALEIEKMAVEQIKEERARLEQDLKKQTKAPVSTTSSSSVKCFICGQRLPLSSKSAIRVHAISHDLEDDNHFFILLHRHNHPHALAFPPL